MSRWAMTLPIVARRSPAITTPSVWVTATIVVPCGASRVMFCVACSRLPGSRSGAWAARKSVKELLAGAKNALGSLPPSRRSMPLTLSHGSDGSVAVDHLEHCVLQRRSLGGHAEKRQVVTVHVADETRPAVGAPTILPPAVEHESLERLHHPAVGTALTPRIWS